MLRPVPQGLPRDRIGKIAIRLLDEKKVAKFRRVAQKRELIFVAAGDRVARLDFARVREPLPRLAEEVERDVGLRNILFEYRSMSDPLTQALGQAANKMTSSTPIPATMNVDYVRVWK